MRSSADFSLPENSRPPDMLPSSCTATIEPSSSTVLVVPSALRTPKNSSEASPSSAPRDWVRKIA